MLGFFRGGGAGSANFIFMGVGIFPKQENHKKNKERKDREGCVGGSCNVGIPGISVVFQRATCCVTATITLPALQKHFVNIFFVFGWEFCIEKWRGFQ